MNGKVLLFALPVEKYSYQIETCFRRPLGPLEAFIFGYLQERGIASTTDLQEAFGVPRLVIVQALALLLEQGFVFVRSEGKFAVASLELEATTPVRTEKSIFSIFVDRYTGRPVDRAMSWTALQNRRIDTDARVIEFRPTGLPFLYDEQRNLEVAERKLIDSVAKRDGYLLDYRLQSRLDLYSVIQIEDGIFDRRRLPINLREFSREYEEELLTGYPDVGLGARTIVLSEPSSAFFGGVFKNVIDSSSSDIWLLTRASDHEEFILRGLANAITFAIVVSAHFASEFNDDASLGRFLALKIAIINAANRGVTVVLVLGFKDQGDRRLENWIQEIREKLNPDAIDRVMYNCESLNSDAKVVIFDTRDGITSAIGSYNWLNPARNEILRNRPFTEATVVIDDPTVACELMRLISGWFDRVDFAIARILENFIANILAPRLPQYNSEAHSAEDGEVILPRRFALLNAYEFLYFAVREAQTKCAIISHKFTDRSLDIIAAASRWRDSGSEVACQVFCGTVILNDPESQARLDRLVADTNFKLSVNESLHARIVILDDLVVITSENILSASRQFRQIAVGFRSKTVVDVLLGELVPM